MNSLERITINPGQCGGRPCIRGMRIRVKDVLDMLAAVEGVGDDLRLRDRTAAPTVKIARMVVAGH